MIRPQKKGDNNAVYAINQTAFDSDAEANLVQELLMSDTNTLSIVSESEGVLNGHLLLSEMTVQQRDVDLKIYGLAPMAVLPAYQRQGIGKQLVQEAIRKAREAFIDAIFVLGHPEYYPRFGFKPTIEYQITGVYDVPPEAFMVLDLGHCLQTLHGMTVCYADAFQKLT